MWIDQEGRGHDDCGRLSAILWCASDRAGRRITLTQAALRHARGEDEEHREARAYLTSALIKQGVERGERYGDGMLHRERLVASALGPSIHLVVVIEIGVSGGTVVTAFAIRRVPNAWGRLWRPL